MPSTFDDGAGNADAAKSGIGYSHLKIGDGPVLRTSPRDSYDRPANIDSLVRRSNDHFRKVVTAHSRSSIPRKYCVVGPDSVQSADMGDSPVTMYDGVKSIAC
jgi:hypothetical protein